MISDHLNTYPDDNNLSLQKKVYRNNRIIKRIQISILNHYHIHTSMIARFTGCNYSVVHRWSRRSETQGNIFDHPRSGRPPVYTETNQIKTIAFYCQISPLPGCNTWSFRWAARYLKEHRQITGCSMSHSTIHRILQKHALKPHKNKYNLAITDPDFFPKMEHIISLLQNQPENLFSFDECTALQAISRLAPELPPEASKERTLEFDYKRHGTTDLMAFLNPKTGQVFGRCTLNHNTQTLINVFIEHVNTLPANANIHYIMDNLNTHFNNDFCKTIATLSGVGYEPLKTGIERRQWLQKDDKRIVIHFIPFHGSWLNLIEIWFGILNKKCLKHQAFQSVPEIQNTIVQFIEIWNTYFAHPFTWKYTGEGLIEKAISRFSKLLLIESQQMDIKFLTKQLMLMTNIAGSYTKKTETKEWRNLTKLFYEKSDYIINIIESETKERQIVKANHALYQFKILMT